MNLLRMSSRRKPNMGVSIVSTNALKPAFSARFTKFLVICLRRKGALFNTNDGPRNIFYVTHYLRVKIYLV